MPEVAPRATHRAAGLKPDNRHRTFYGAPDQPPADKTRNQMMIRVGIDPDDGSRDNLLIDIPGSYDRLGLRLVEPIAHDLFNAPLPLAPTEEILVTFRRWRGYLDRMDLRHLPEACPIGSPTSAVI